MPSISESGVKQLLVNCPDIRRIKLQNWMESPLILSEELIDLFKERAKQMPKIDYYFGIKVIDPNLYLELLKYLPGNLRIELL